MTASLATPLPDNMQALQSLQDSSINAATKRNKDIDKATKQFESMFLAQMLSHISSGVEVDPLFGGGPGEEMFRSMLNDQYAQSMTERGGVGIAPAVKAELLKLQEGGK